MKKFYSEHKWLIVALFIFLCTVYYFFWSVLKPYNYGPDEYVRFPLIYYIYKNNALPNGWLPEVRSKLWGFSYAFYYTWLPSLCSAFCMKLAALFSSSANTVFLASRFPNVLAGAGSVFMIFKISDRLTDNEKLKWFVTITFASIPQFAFLTSYINNDCFAVLGSMIICYCWIKGIYGGWKVKHCILLGIGISINLLSYYNSYGWIALSLIVFFVSFAFGKNKGRKNKAFIYALVVAAVALLIAGFFIIRNIYIYNGDVFGLKSLKESAEMYAIDELKPSLHSTGKLEGRPFVSMLHDRAWIKASLLSFIGNFSYMMFMCPNFVYSIYIAIFVLGFVFFIVDHMMNVKTADKETKKTEWLFRVAIFVAFLIPIFLSMYYSWGTDYQAQGRYLYPMLPALCIFVLCGFERIGKIVGNGGLLLKRIGSITLLLLSIAAITASLYSFFYVYVPSSFGNNSVFGSLYILP